MAAPRHGLRAHDGLDRGPATRICRPSLFQIAFRRRCGSMLLQRQSICLGYLPEKTGYAQPSQIIGFGMSKLNLEQTVPHSRDVGGLSSKSVLALANAVALVWALLIHFRP